MRQFFSGILITFFLAATSQASGYGDGVAQTMERMKQASAAITDMNCVFSQTITKEGRQIPETRMDLRYLKSPETIYLKYINRHEGQECLYISGQNDGKLLVRPAGLLGFMTFNIDPAGDTAMEECLEPITALPFHAVISEIDRWVETARDIYGVESRIERNVMDGDRLCDLLKISDTNQDGFAEIYIDPSTGLPCKIRQQKNPANSALYKYENLRINTGITASQLAIE